MGTAADYAQWIVKNEAKQGTPEFETISKAYREAKALETLGEGQGEFAGESVLYERPQVGVGRKLAQSAGKGVAGALDVLIGAPEAVKPAYNEFFNNKPEFETTQQRVFRKMSQF